MTEEEVLFGVIQSYELVAVAQKNLAFADSIVALTERLVNKQQNYYDLDFNLKDASELLQCNLRVFSNNKAVLTIYSNQRNMIRYQGEVEGQN